MVRVGYVASLYHGRDPAQNFDIFVLQFFVRAFGTFKQNSHLKVYSFFSKSNHISAFASM